jgi:hypothetical protein
LLLLLLLLLLVLLLVEVLEESRRAGGLAVTDEAGCSTRHLQSKKESNTWLLCGHSCHHHEALSVEQSLENAGCLGKYSNAKLEAAVPLLPHNPPSTCSAAAHKLAGLLLLLLPTRDRGA